MEKCYVVIGYFEETYLVFGTFSTIDKANDFIEERANLLKIGAHYEPVIDKWRVYVEETIFYG